MRYLLPCTCGRKIPVSSSQAGETLTCECGQSLTAPKLRELRQLETAPDTQPPARRLAWSQMQGVLFLFGGLLLLAAGVVVVLAMLQRTQLVTEQPQIIPERMDEYLAEIDRNSPAENYEVWKTEVLEEGLHRSHEPDFVYHRRIAQVIDRVLIGAGVAAAIGVALIVAAFVVRPRSPSS